MDPLDHLNTLIDRARYDRRFDYVDGHRALHIYARASELATDVVAVDGHFAVAYEPGTDLEAIAPVAAIGLAVRRIDAMLAPAVTA